MGSDTQVARFFSEDPITAQYPELTPYQFASNCPISGDDLDGGEFRLRIHSPYVSAKLNPNGQGTDGESVRFYQRSVKTLGKGGASMVKYEYAGRAIKEIGGMINVLSTRQFSKEHKEWLCKNNGLEANETISLCYDPIFIKTGTLVVESYTGETIFEMYADMNVINLVKDAQKTLEDVNKYKEIAKEGKTSAAISITIGAGGVIASSIIMLTGEFTPLGFLGMGFSMDELYGGLKALEAIERGIFANDKEYKFVKGYIIECGGGHAGLLYDITAVAAGGASFYDDAASLAKQWPSNTLSGAKLNSLLYGAAGTSKGIYELPETQKTNRKDGKKLSSNPCK